MNKERLKTILEELKKETGFNYTIIEETEIKDDDLNICEPVCKIQFDRNFSRIYNLMNQLYKNSLFQKKENDKYIVELSTMF